MGAQDNEDSWRRNFFKSVDRSWSLSWCLFRARLDREHLGFRSGLAGTHLLVLTH